MRRKNPPPSGLIVSGQIIERTRRKVPFDNPTTEIVTYTISSDTNKRYYVDDFSPSSYYEIGSTAELSVYIKPFKKRNGDPSYTLCIQKDFHSTKGERF